MKFKTETGKSDVFSTPEIMANDLNNWQGWYCYAGIENIAIDFFGNVQRAWCGAPNVYIGNITEGITLPSEPIVCQISNCHCGFDMMCTKVKSTQNQPRTPNSQSQVSGNDKRPQGELPPLKSRHDFQGKCAKSGKGPQKSHLKKFPSLTKFYEEGGGIHSSLKYQSPTPE